MKSADKAKVKAYVKKWQNLKVRLGCACGVLLLLIIPRLLCDVFAVMCVVRMLSGA